MTDTFTTDRKKSVRAYRSTPTAEMVTDNTLTTITKWKYVWKNSNGEMNAVDFKELKAYSTDEHIRLLISKFEQSGWREPTKYGQFSHIRSVLRHAFNAQGSKQKVEFS